MTVMEKPSLQSLTPRDVNVSRGPPIKVPSLPLSARTSSFPATGTPRSKRVYRVDASNLIRQPAGRRNSLPDIRPGSTELNEAQATIRKLEKELSNLKEALAMSHLHQRGHNKFISGAQFRAPQGETQRRSCGQCYTLKEKVKQLTAQLQEAKEEGAQLRDKSAEAQESLSAERTEHNRTKAQLTQLQKELGAADRKMQGGVDQLDQLRLRVKTLQGELEQSRKAEAEAKEAVEAQKAAHHKCNAKAADAKRELEGVRTESKTQASRLELVTCELEKLRASHQALTETRDKQGADATHERDRLKQELMQEKRAAEALSESCSVLEADKVRLQQALEDAWFTGGKVSALQTELTKAQDQLTKLRGQLKDGEERLEKEKGAHVNCAKALEEAKRREVELGSQVKTHEQALSDAQTTLANERKQFAQQKKMYEREAEELKMLLENAQSDLVKLRHGEQEKESGRVEELRKKLQELQTELEREREEGRRQKGLLEDRVRQEESRLAALRGDEAARDETLKKLTKKLEAEENRRRNLQEGKLAVEKSLADSEAELRKLKNAKEESRRVLEKERARAKAETKQTIEKMLESQVQVVVSAPCVRLSIQSGQNLAYRPPAEAVHRKIKATLEQDVLPQYLSVFTTAMGKGHDAADSYAKKFITDMTKEINTQVMPLIYKDLPKNMEVVKK